MKRKAGNKSGIGFGFLLTSVIHGALLMVFVLNSKSCVAESDAETSLFKEAKTIEAGLAFKKKKRKNKQPQKLRKKKFAPPEPVKVLKEDAPQIPEKVKEKKKVQIEEDEIDPLSVLEKNRKQDEDLSETGVDEETSEQGQEGSEWGTEEDAIGDPYVGEVKGRVFDAWEVPLLEAGVGKVVGCLRLSEAGKIKDIEVVKNSSNANLNRSVKLALKNASNMDKPVPSHLKTLLIGKGICFNFVLD